MIGLNIYQDSNEEGTLLKELKEFLDSDYGYIAYHMPPDASKEAFIRQCHLLNEGHKQRSRLKTILKRLFK